MVWERLKDPATGKSYFYNVETQVTQWEFPEDVFLQKLDENRWSKATTSDSDGGYESNKVYFYSNDTGESSWTIPEIVLSQLKAIFGDELTESEILGDDSASIALQEAAVDDQTTVPAKDVNDNREQSNINSEKTNDNDVIDLSKKVTLGKIISVNQLIKLDDILNGLKTSDIEPKRELTKKTTEECEDEYIAMLTEFDIDSNSTFNDVIEKCSGDERYWNIEEPLARSRLYEVYLMKKSTDEFNKSKEKYRKEFYDVLAKHKVKYYTRWSTCSKAIIDENLYNFLSDKIKKDFFDEYVNELRNEKEKISKELKSKEAKALEEELDTNVTISSEFAKMVLQLEEKYKNLSKVEMLDIFERVIEKREQEQVSFLEIEKKKNYRFDRTVRMAFKNMLNLMIANKDFTPTTRTKWFEFVTLLKDKPEFIELCGHRGSSAIDFYWDILDGEYIKLGDKKELVKQQLINANKKISDLSESEFVEVLKRSTKPEVLAICIDDLKTIYTQLKPSLIPSAPKRSIGAVIGQEATTQGVEKRQKILLRKNNV